MRDRGEGILEGRAGQRLVAGIGLRAGDVRIGPGLALECDFLALAHERPDSMARARSKSSGVSTPSGTLSTIGDVDAHAGFERAQLLELLAAFERRGRQRDEALERRAAIGVEADVMIERPLAGRRGGAGEVERAQPAGRRPGVPTTLTTLGLVRSSAACDLGGKRGDIDGRVGERRQRGDDVGAARASAGRPAR